MSRQPFPSLGRAIPLKVLALALMLLCAACASPSAGVGGPTTEQSGAAIPATATAAQPTATSEPDSAATNGGMLCPEVPRPALVAEDAGIPAAMVLLMSIDGQQRCQVALEGEQRGEVVGAAGSLFYPLIDEATGVGTIWQLGTDGINRPLSFTSQPMAGYGPFQFTVSPDGKQIAWSTVQSAFGDPAGPVYTNTLQIANLDGSKQRVLLDGVVTRGLYVHPLRFSDDGATLFYAQQPDGLGGVWMSFHGRYHQLFQLPVAGGEPTSIFDCEAYGRFLCIGDFTTDGNFLVYTDPDAGVVRLVSRADEAQASFAGASPDYVGFPSFGPDGTLVFTSAVVNEASEMLPMPEPGTISRVAAPYDGAATPILQAAGISSVWRWLDAQHLVYMVLSEQDGGIGILTVGGQSQNFPGIYPLTVLDR